MFYKVMLLFIPLLASCVLGIPDEEAYDENWLDWENEYDFETGTSYYCDPVSGSIGGTGTSDDPFPALSVVLENDLVQRYVYEDHPYSEGMDVYLHNPDAPIAPGDTLILLPGNHGNCELSEAHNPEFITIKSQTPHTAVLSGIRFVGAEKFRLTGVTVTREGGGSLLSIENHNWRGPSKHIIAENCTLYSSEDTSSWTADDWVSRAASGIQANGEYLIVRNNTIRNVDFGITASGQYLEIFGNTIDGFAGDGMRGIGKDMLFEKNSISTCYNVDDNHDDGFQSFSTESCPVPSRIVLRANYFFSVTDPQIPLSGTFQGIGCFDGFYKDWKVENNLVITDHYHGITFLGAINCVIINNTVIDSDMAEETPGPLWIRITDHKNGEHSSDCLVRNNLVSGPVMAGPGVDDDHNLTVTEEEGLLFFLDYRGRDFRLRSDSPAVDAGKAEKAPEQDFAGNPRPRGNRVDIGAYESF